jgi:hypothetical protein
MRTVTVVESWQTGKAETIRITARSRRRPSADPRRGD